MAMAESIAENITDWTSIARTWEWDLDSDKALLHGGAKAKDDMIQDFGS